MTEEAREGPYIRDLRPGQEISGTFGVAGKRLRAFRDPSKGRFLQLQLRDVTGTIVGMVWDDAERAAEELSVGDVVCVRAQVEEYRGKTQLVLRSIDPAASAEVVPERFIPEAPRPLPEMEDELWRRVEAVTNPHLSQLLLILFEDRDTYTGFTRAPAGKTVHHNYLHGLLEHSLEVVSLLLCGDGRRDMDEDLLITGGLLHDLGKIDEYFCSAAIGFTDQGRLLGHIVTGYQRVRAALRRVPEVPHGLALHLLHLIVSHHGRLEYGSPVLPQTREAVALHHADLFSGKVGQVDLIAAEAAEANRQWSDFDPVLGRYVWMPDHGQPPDSREEES